MFFIYLPTVERASDTQVSQPLQSGALLAGI
jgi:hypothetical protein